MTKGLDLRTLPMLVAFSGLLTGSLQAVTTTGKILVVLSSENQLILQEGKHYSTGYYFNEFTVPVRKLKEAGYEITIANPKGNRPTMDAHSDSATYFGGDQNVYNDFKQFHSGLDELKHPVKLAKVVSEGLDKFDGLFIPGGHAPMIDLLKDPELRKVLLHFHSQRKPTAMICHGPISLLATLPDASGYATALTKRDLSGAKALAKNWIYSGYNVTIFSSAEEKIAEGKQLGGKMLFYPDVALATAGAHVQNAKEWKSNALRDRELITGQNPYSDAKFSDLLIAALGEKERK